MVGRTVVSSTLEISPVAVALLWCYRAASRTGSRRLIVVQPVVLQLQGCDVRMDHLDVLQLSKSGQRTIGRVDRAPSHAATSNSVWMT